MLKGSNYKLCHNGYKAIYFCIHIESTEVDGFSLKQQRKSGSEMLLRHQSFCCSTLTKLPASDAGY